MENVSDQVVFAKVVVCVCVRMCVCLFVWMCVSLTEGVKETFKEAGCQSVASECFYSLNRARCIVKIGVKMFLIVPSFFFLIFFI